MAIGRINHVPRSAGDKYYFRILINIVKGPTSFDDIKTANKIIYKNFKKHVTNKGYLTMTRSTLKLLKEQVYGILMCHGFKSFTPLITYVFLVFIEFRIMFCIFFFLYRVL